jgi:signal transduction histidine kinase
MFSSPRHLYARVRGLDPVRVDQAVAAVLLIGFEVTAATAWGERAWVGAAIGPLIAVAVANRRRRTLQALGLACGAMVAKRLLVGDHTGGGSGFGLIGLVLLFYSAGAYLDGWRVWLGLGIVTALGAAVSFKGASVLAGVFSVFAFVWLPWLVGRASGFSAAHERAARELAERVDVERDLHVRTAALNERVRLAREIHDVIAHSVSVMVIQAAGARTVMDREPARAEESLRSVERAGREALAEMRRLLGVLGDRQDLRALAPQPGLDDLPELVSSTRDAGLDTSIRVEGEPVAVSQGLSLCIYRVVQEALTNTLKYAGPTRAEVSVCWEQDALELQVTDAGGRRAQLASSSSGHGLAGMSERVALHGGRVDAGPACDGGFIVRARIPLLAGSGS